MALITWERQPYMTVLKSAIITTGGSSSDPQEDPGSELPMLAVLWTCCQNCQHWQFCGWFGPSGKKCLFCIFLAGPKTSIELQPSAILLTSNSRWAQKDP